MTSNEDFTQLLVRMLLKTRTGLDMAPGVVEVCSALMHEAYDWGRHDGLVGAYRTSSGEMHDSSEGGEAPLADCLTEETAIDPPGEEQETARVDIADWLPGEEMLVSWPAGRRVPTGQLPRLERGDRLLLDLPDGSKIDCVYWYSYHEICRFFVTISRYPEHSIHDLVLINVDDLALSLGYEVEP